MILTWVFSGLLLGATVSSPPASREVCEAYGVILRDRGATGECRQEEAAPEKKAAIKRSHAARHHRPFPQMMPVEWIPPYFVARTLR